MHAKTLLRKVPEISIIFWAIKLLTTAMGESTSDFIVAKFNPYLAVAAGGLIFIAALALQFRVTRYIPFVYWFTVAMVAVFGTMCADGLHVQLGVPYIFSASGFACVLCLIFICWHYFEHSLSIHEITNRRREVFYWLTVSATFALGTALGDLFANTLNFGYFSSGLIFLILITIPAIVYMFTKRNGVLYFWIAYIMTRPVGASFADWMGKSKFVGGLGYGDGYISILLTCIIIILVAYITYKKFRTAASPGKTAQ
jgi:uncharacterized membrane-anchored protein